MIVLSLFDGMSCGRIALEREGITVTKYYASEIDKYAEKISASNYPDIIRLGDITKWREWDIETPDIIIAGSPCQGFSFAGKGLNFEDPRSALFFVFADILKHYHPKYFLLENVKMKAEHNDVISSLLGEIYPECVNQGEIFRTGRLEPVLINSALVSAQNRERLYWCNWKVEQPKDMGIYLKDIIENGQTEREKSYCIDANYANAGDEKSYLEHGRRQLIANNRKSESCELRRIKNRKQLNEKASTLLSLSWKGEDANGVTIIPVTYSGASGGNLEPETSTDKITWRKLTVTECERLQTVPDGYCRAVSNFRAYHALGNGWTVDVIAHILKEGIK
jgi:DNA-cytosine methyltransferase